MTTLIQNTLIAFVAVCILTGCSIPSAELRRKQAQHLAESAGWSEFSLSTSLFDLTGFAPDLQQQDKLLTIYFEGDGMANPQTSFA
jgi:hypothetical protein